MIPSTYLVTGVFATLLGGIGLALAANAQASGYWEHYACLAMAIAVLWAHERWQRPFLDEMARKGVGFSRMRQFFDTVVTAALSAAVLRVPLDQAGVAYGAGDSAAFGVALAMCLLALASGAACTALVMRQHDLINVRMLKAHEARRAELAAAPAVNLTWSQSIISAYLVSTALLVPPMASEGLRLAMTVLSLAVWYLLTSRNLRKAGMPELGWLVQLATYFPVLLSGAIAQYILSHVLQADASVLGRVAWALASVVTLLVASTLAVMALHGVPQFSKNARYFEREPAAR